MLQNRIQILKMTIFTIVERTFFLKWGERAQRNDRQKNQQFEHQHQRQQQQQKQKRKKLTDYIEFKFDIPMVLILTVELGDHTKLIV